MFQPILPLTGFAGWTFLERTLENQQSAFDKQASVSRATDYFRDSIGDIKTASDLVNDRQLLSVALGAFGLDDDLGNKFFIEKILSDGTTADDALANRLADKSYAKLSEAFGFGDPIGPLTGLDSFANDIVSRFQTKQFERAVGDQNPDLRLALGLEQGLKDITSQSTSETAQWFTMMGTPPLRKVFETALGLPSSLARIDLDQQLSTFQDKSQAVFGTRNISDFLSGEKTQDLRRLFLIRSEAAAIQSSGAANIALTLLQSAPRLF